MHALPTAADEAKFRNLVEAAWRQADADATALRYCRGFIVALGREYYEAVAADPSVRHGGRRVRVDLPGELQQPGCLGGLST